MASRKGGGDYLTSTELYDPATGTFSAGPTLLTARKAPTLTLLGNGNVLICGGQSDFSTYLNTCEIFNSLEWEPESPEGLITQMETTMGDARAGHTATLLQNGDVLICGGIRAQNTPNSSCYLFSEGTLSAVQPMNEARASHTATVLVDGRVLVVGGRSASAALASSEIYNPETNAWSDADNLSQARYLHSATLLPDGCVVVAGGYSGSAALDSVEIYCGFQITREFCEYNACWHVPPTNQTACYNNSSSISCPGTPGTESCGATEFCGQDSQYEDNERTYTCYNANGSVQTPL